MPFVPGRVVEGGTGDGGIMQQLPEGAAAAS